MSNRDLFDVGERDVHGMEAVDSRGRRKMPRRLCIPTAIGSGPKGETCRTCAHYVRRGSGAGVYRKCGKWESKQ